MRKTILASFMICLFSLMILIPPVLSQIELDLTYEITCEVISATTLWNPGTHDFEIICDGQLFTPFSDTFAMDGFGTATYSMVGGGWPPGEFDLTMNFSGYLSNSFFDGPYDISVVCHGETVLVEPPTPGFVRTEEIRNLSANGTFNEYTWDVTIETATVDFSYIDPEGKAFDIQITGGSHIYIVPEFPSLIILPILMIVTLLAVIMRVRMKGRFTSKR